MSPLALTPGEPAGIGPDICLQLWARGGVRNTLIFADADMLQQRADTLRLDVPIERVVPDQQPLPSDCMAVVHQPCAEPVDVGVLNPTNAAYVLACLRSAVDACERNTCAALVTGPVHKGVIADAGYEFSGHTEFLRELCAVEEVLMLLVAPHLRVALASVHIPLAQVASAITPDTLERRLLLLDQGLRDRFGIEQPHILVAGLNPHAGENGHLGDEEQRVITPVLERLRARGLQLTGPLPADTLYTPQRLAGADAVMAMYHDQGLPVLKAGSFGEAVNITLGLPILRTSVDHGTALEIAGSGDADCGSLAAAVNLAQQQTAGAAGA